MARIIREENVEIGKMLQKARESRHCMQSELTDACNLSKNHISAVERGASQGSIRMLLSYCEKLNMTPNEILGFHSNFIEEQLNPILKNLTQKEQEKVLDIAKIISR